MAPLLTPDAARALAQRILGAVQGDGASVHLVSERTGHTRYVGNQAVVSADVSAVWATLTVRMGTRRAAMTFDAFGADALTQAVTTAEQLARRAPEDPERLPLLGPQTYPHTQAFFSTTDELGVAARKAAIETVAGRAAQAGTIATGFAGHRSRAEAVVNTAGLFAFHRSTIASHTVTVRSAQGTGSGWAGTTHNDWARMTPAQDLADRAVDKARRSRDARPVSPGAYTVLLEPTAAGSLVRLVGDHLDARAAAEGRSCFALAEGATRVTQAVAAPSVTLVSDPSDPAVGARPFTDEGLPLGRATWIENGVLQDLARTREWAARTHQSPRPYPGFVALDGHEGGAFADLLAGIERGLLITRFASVRESDPRAASYTGVTRDGTFLIEHGKVTGAVKNLRFTESVVGMLERVERLGRAERVVASDAGDMGPAVVAPPLVVRAFQFTSVSDAV